MPTPASLPVHRAAGLGRAAFQLLAAACFALPVVLVWPVLRFAPSGGAIRWQDYAVAWLLLLSALVSLGLALRGVRWLRLAAWRGPLRVEVDATGVRAELGPFGRWSVAWGDMAIDWPEYLFQLDLDRERALPMRECPPLRDAQRRLRVDVILRQHVAVSEDVWWPILEPLLRPRLFTDPRWE